MCDLHYSDYRIRRLGEVAAERDRHDEGPALARDAGLMFNPTNKSNNHSNTSKCDLTQASDALTCAALARDAGLQGHGPVLHRDRWKSLSEKGGNPFRNKVEIPFVQIVITIISMIIIIITVVVVVVAIINYDHCYHN